LRLQGRLRFLLHRDCDHKVVVVVVAAVIDYYIENIRRVVGAAEVVVN